ncbi:hypothetical protein LSH36_9g11035 [Paralvinella palmiformis]|uniref:Uncharacterized protein n=1 Tax=Paralvinella palmiformis TaxID=53620 RepID=A0AAD9KEX9_9ANNE|nr:hypothetical protein LSH36_9g11035 [Paralvinella palmiformis]
MAIHYERNLIFFVDLNGTVLMIPMLNDDDEQQEFESMMTHAIKYHYSDRQPEAMSVDWLNNYLYIAENYQVSVGHF